MVMMRDATFHVWPQTNAESVFFHPLHKILPVSTAADVESDVGTPLGILGLRQVFEGIVLSSEGCEVGAVVVDDLKGEFVLCVVDAACVGADGFADTYDTESSAPGRCRVDNLIDSRNRAGSPGPLVVTLISLGSTKA